MHRKRDDKRRYLSDDRGVCRSGYPHSERIYKYIIENDIDKRSDYLSDHGMKRLSGSYQKSLGDSVAYRTDRYTTAYAKVFASHRHNFGIVRHKLHIRLCEKSTEYKKYGEKHDSEKNTVAGCTADRLAISPAEIFRQHSVYPDSRSHAYGDHHDLHGERGG